MARVVHLKLSKRAEQVVQALEDEGLTAQDIFAKALYLLERAWSSKRVAMLREDTSFDNPAVQYVFSIGTASSGAAAAKGDGGPIPSTAPGGPIAVRAS